MSNDDNETIGFGSREFQIEFIQDRLLPRLGTQNWSERFSADSEEVEDAGTVLATVYHDLGVPAGFSSVLLLLGLLLVDLLFVLNSQVYGLFLDL
jgi:hypothetical protein